MVEWWRGVPNKPMLAKADVPYSAQNNVVAIATGNRTSFALRTDNSVVAWGNVPLDATTILATIAANKNAVAIAAGADKIAVITDGGTIKWCANQNTHPNADTNDIPYTYHSSVKQRVDCESNWVVYHE
jgi:alpha-tubulin suppressor-like RCC1 family protein